MGLPWARLDGNIAGNDKITALLADRSRCSWQAAAVYVFAIGWSVAQGTDGWITREDLPTVHGNVWVARLLVKHRLWEMDGDGRWHIHNFEKRQALALIADAMASDAQRERGRKGACKLHHAEWCWVEGKGCRGIPKGRGT